MIKKPYLQPTTNLVEVKIVQLVCASLKRTNSKGLDDDESLDYGDDETTEQNAWGNAW